MPVMKHLRTICTAHTCCLTAATRRARLPSSSPRTKTRVAPDAGSVSCTAMTAALPRGTSSGGRWAPTQSVPCRLHAGETLPGRDSCRPHYIQRGSQWFRQHTLCMLVQHVTSLWCCGWLSSVVLMRTCGRGHETWRVCSLILHQKLEDVRPGLHQMAKMAEAAKAEAAMRANLPLHSACASPK